MSLTLNDYILSDLEGVSNTLSFPKERDYHSYEIVGLSYNTELVFFIILPILVIGLLGLFLWCSTEIKKRDQKIKKYKLENKIADVLLKKQKQELAFIKSGRGRALGHFFETKMAANCDMVTGFHEHSLKSKPKEKKISYLPFHDIIANQLRPLYPNFSDAEIQHCVFLYLEIPEDKTAKTLQMQISEVQTIRCKVRSKILKNNVSNFKSHVKSLMMN
ncbi:hypothetical protein AWE51_14380 [Aquimarina aggregata]|uniref:Uncharacterized protein n=1 Tax=Aquimarina aggregata TaxID=1642818 RepID=A0A162XTR5_9FLAO|nr:hypothetical protein [Aquimarina aggregata]KZS38770.1 hypothetical protein AWE51_14380 [Aquimarina aggregata]